MSDGQPSAPLWRKLRLLLEESLPLWGLSGSVEPSAGDERLILVRDKDVCLAVRPGPPGNGPIRWLVTSTAEDRPARDCPCTSVLGVLGVIRATLTGAHGAGPRLRIGSEP